MRIFCDGCGAKCEARSGHAVDDNGKRIWRGPATGIAGADWRREVEECVNCCVVSLLVGRPYGACDPHWGVVDMRKTLVSAAPVTGA